MHTPSDLCFDKCFKRNVLATWLIEFLLCFFLLFVFFYFVHTRIFFCLTLFFFTDSFTFTHSELKFYVVCFMLLFFLFNCFFSVAPQWDWSLIRETFFSFGFFFKTDYFEDKNANMISWKIYLIIKCVCGLKCNWLELTVNPCNILYVCCCVDYSIKNR